jgi:hypothetical protein
MKTFVTAVEGVSYTVIVGQNKHDNWELMDDADPGDIWFHANGSSSAHVILQAPESGVVPISIVRFCAEKTKCLDVIYTHVANIRKGRHVGEAIILDTKKVHRNIMRSYSNEPIQEKR